MTIAIDRWNPNADIIFVSHAHMDHLPNMLPYALEKTTMFKQPKQFICSKITKEIFEARTSGKFSFPKSMWLLGKDASLSQSVEYNGIKLTLLENGHAYGSTSLFVEGSETIFHTSDFITEDRKPLNGQEIRGLKPIKCDCLIMECTFGAPKFIFPSFDNIQNDIKDYVQKQIDEGHPVILLGYAFGKSQLLLNMIDTSFEVLLDKSIAKNTKILENNRIKFREWVPYDKYNKKRLKDLHDYVLIIPPNAMFEEPYNYLIKEGAKVVSFSGKVLSESYRKEFPADKYITLSDHCDFKELIDFVQKCDPIEVYLDHGKIEEFSFFLSKILNNTLVKCLISSPLNHLTVL